MGKKDSKALYVCALGHEHSKHISVELGKLEIELQNAENMRAWGLYTD